MKTDDLPGAVVLLCRMVPFLAVLHLSLLIVPALAAPMTGDDVPSSPRAREAIARVRPILEQELTEKGLAYGSPIFIRIFKKSKELEVWISNADRFVLFKSYRICHFSGGLGPKLRRGDEKSPEGFYYVPPGNLNPSSRYHLSFNLGYPNAFDRIHGRTGSALMVHGNCVSIGCYAMTDSRIEEIYALVDAALRNGQPFFRVHIFPFRMTEVNMARHAQDRWFGFWENLKEGYDCFERSHRPPNVIVRDKRYVFEPR